MSWHPLTLSILLLDGVTAVLYLAAAARLLIVLPGWNAAGSDREQLNRERGYELVVCQGRWIMALQASSFILLVIAISNVWPDYVPGAMCGLGVMQAMGPAGHQTLIVRLLLLGLLLGWHILMHIERQHPVQQVPAPAGRLLLMAGPLITAGAFALWRALLAVRPDHPVSCCATVYAQAGVAAPALDIAWASMNWTLLCSLGAAVALLHGVALGYRPEQNQSLFRRAPAALILLWLPVAYMTLKYKTAPYLLEVLYHPCPWCLLLSEHGIIGFALFGSLAWVGAETVAGEVAGLAAHRYPALQGAAHARRQQSGRRIVAGSLIFIALVLLPALFWRWRFGVWMT
jgi:hypothetical protein